MTPEERAERVMASEFRRPAIAREIRAAAREAAKQMKERCATFLEMDVFGTPQGELDHLASAIRALPIEGAEGGE